MIDDPRRVKLKLFQPIERSFDDIIMEITIYLIPVKIESIGSHIKEVLVRSNG